MREEGYYWVKMKGFDWEIAFWSARNKTFKLTGIQGRYGASYFEEIIETPITRNT